MLLRSPTSHLPPPMSFHGFIMVDWESLFEPRKQFYRKKDKYEVPCLDLSSYERVCMYVEAFRQPKICFSLGWWEGIGRTKDL